MDGPRRLPNGGPTVKVLDIVPVPAPVKVEVMDAPDMVWPTTDVSISLTIRAGRPVTTLPAAWVRVVEVSKLIVPSGPTVEDSTIHTSPAPPVIWIRAPRRNDAISSALIMELADGTL